MLNRKAYCYRAQKQPAERDDPAGEAADQEVLSDVIDTDVRPFSRAFCALISGNRMMLLAATTAVAGRELTAQSEPENQDALHRAEQPAALEPVRRLRFPDGSHGADGASTQPHQLVSRHQLKQHHGDGHE